MSSSGSSWRSATSTKGNEAQYCETICNMLTMLSCNEMDAHRVLLAMTNSPESCQSLRRAGCIPLLIQILHPGSTTPPESHPSPETKQRASKALKNIVHFNPDERMKRKELRVLRLLESIRTFTNSTNNPERNEIFIILDKQAEKHPTNSSTTLMKLSFDDEHKNTMCTLGAIHALADLILSDHKVHGPQPTDLDCILIRRYSCMTLTNLTFGDGVNKALLCSMSEFLIALVSQLEFENEDIVQVTASVLRNLSWHADSDSKDSLRDAKAVHGLMKAAVRATKESTLKATLSALWNLSAHSSQNKAAVCSTPNALKFLLSLLRRNKSMTVVENAGGILGSVSSHIAGVDEYRMILRECHCFEILLEHLRSPSLAVVSNACGTLWNLSENEEEQRNLLELNAVPMLKSLEYSKHERIRQGAREALRNILYGKELNELHQSPSLDTNGDGEDQPLDLTITSCSSSPARKLNPPPFLNPPIYNGNISSTRSCPDIQVKQQKIESSSADEIFNYSHYDEEEEDEEEEKNQQKDTVKTYCDEGTPGFSGGGSMVDLSNQAVDTLIQYQVEDTPAVFSRTSSLSSIEENQNGDTKVVEEKGISSGKKSVLNIQLSSPHAQPTEISTIPAPVNAILPSSKRSVAFSAQETPLMFSRSSSVGSLGSCGDLNNGPCESDCVSEFSRRTSEAVSPSELPDSPPRGEDLMVNSQNLQQAVDQPIFSQMDDNKICVPATTTNDEVRVFAVEGTPFFVCTPTSLSDIVGELDNQVPTRPDQTTLQESTTPPSTTKDQQQQQSKSKSMECTDDPVYSDAQLLQKCIKAGRAVGWVKKKTPTVAQEEHVDLSHLIQRGRAKLVTRSEDNLKQFATNSLVKPFNGLPLHETNDSQQQQPSNTQNNNNCQNNNIPLKNINGSIPCGYNINLLPPQNKNEHMENMQVDASQNETKDSDDDDEKELVSKEEDRPLEMEPTTKTTISLTMLDRLTDKISNINLEASPVGHYSPSENSLYVNDNEKIEGTVTNTTTTTTVTTVKENNFAEKDENTDDNTSQSDDMTWAEETPSLSSIPSMSITKAMKIVARKEETLSDIEQPTLNSNSLISSTGFHAVDSHQKQIQKLMLLSSSSQVSNLMNQKQPEFVDLENSMISIASIKSEIFYDDTQLMSSSLHHSQTANVPTTTTTTTTNPNIIANNSNSIITSNCNNSIPCDTNKLASPVQSKYDTYVIKRIESPKERRKNDPERYLTRTIAKFDLKMAKPVILPKPSPSSATSPLVTTAIVTGATTSVRPTRASELRANHSRENSPTNSTSLNITLPKNAKLMENSIRSSHGLTLTPETSPKDCSKQPAQQHAKLNFGRLGNLFRKGFSNSVNKDSEKWGKKKDIWVKKREKALVPPFNYKPPPSSETNFDGMNGNSSSTTTTITPSCTSTGKATTKITTV